MQKKSKNTSDVKCTDLENVLDTKREPMTTVMRLFVKRFAYGARLAEKFSVPHFSVSVLSFSSSSFSESVFHIIIIIFIQMLLLSLCSLYARMRTHFVILSSFFYFQRRKKITSTEESLSQVQLLQLYVWCIVADADADAVVVVCLLFAKHFRVFPLLFSVKTDDHQSEYVFHICRRK